MKKYFVLSGGVLVILLVISACFPLPRHMKAYSTFHGAKSPCDSWKDKNILIVHGMSYKDTTYADFFMSQTLREFAMGPTEKRSQRVYFHPINSSVEIYEAVEKDTMPCGRHRKIRFFAVHWADITKPAKDELGVWDKDWRRVLLSKALKRSVVVDGFGDVMLYLEDERYKKAIQLTYLHSMKAMMIKDPFEGFPDHPQQFKGELIGPNEYDSYLVSGSFGSKIMLDVLDSLVDVRDSLYFTSSHGGANLRVLNVDDNTLDRWRFQEKMHQRFVGSLRSWTMATNQIPLFELGVLAGCDPLSGDTSMTPAELYVNVLADACGFTDSLLNQDIRRDTIDVIVFNDPNDMLGFRIPEEFEDQHNIHLANVTLTNAVWRIPFLAANPGTAHSNAISKNRHLVKMFVHGCRKTKNCMRCKKGRYTSQKP